MSNDDFLSRMKRYGQPVKTTRKKKKTTPMKTLQDLAIGDGVIRTLGGAVEMKLKVTAFTPTRIVCGAWEFDRATGAEIDEELGWGPQFGVTVSTIAPIQL